MPKKPMVDTPIKNSGEYFTFALAVKPPNAKMKDINRSDDKIIKIIPSKNDV